MRHLTAAVLLALSSTALAADPPRNAALDYHRAGLLSPRATGATESAMNKLDWEKIGANLDPSKMPPEFEAARKELSDEAVRHFLLAASTPMCDFQPHTEDGWKMVLPELAAVRNLSRHVRFDARCRLMAGDAPGAAAHVVAMYHAAAHVATEDTLISTLVGAAIAHSADDETKVLAASGKLGDDDRARLLEALRPLLKNDGLHFRAALEGEHRITSGWLKREYSDPAAPARFVREFVSGIPESAAATTSAAIAISKLTPEQFASAAGQMDKYYEQMLVAWDRPDAKATLGALETRLVQGDFGPIAQVLAPAMSKVRSAYEKCMDNLKAAEDALLKKP